MDADRRFTYAYKYGRKEGEVQEYVKVVPFSTDNIPAETIDRFKSSIAPTYELIKLFHTNNPKVGGLNQTVKIK